MLIAVVNHVIIIYMYIFMYIHLIVWADQRIKVYSIANGSVAITIKCALWVASYTIAKQLKNL